MRRVVLAVFAMVILSACSSQDAPPAVTGADEGEQDPQITMLDEGVWPVNTYTDGLPVPAGTVRWAALDPEQENCSIHLADISETEYQDYMELLKQEGFSVIEETSEEIKGQDYSSVNALLSNGEKGLSISYIPDSLTIYISFAE